MRNRIELYASGYGIKNRGSSEDNAVQDSSQEQNGAVIE